MGEPQNQPELDDAVRSGVAGFSLKQAVLMNLLFFVLMFAGALVVDVIPVDVYPDVDLDQANIDTVWLGASAEDVERLVTDRIEAEIQDVKGIRRFTSDSKPDASLIRIAFREDLTVTELDAAFRQLRAAVDRVDDLPPEAEKPRVTRISLSEIFPLLWVVVEDVGQAGEETLHEIARALEPILRDIPGIAKIDDKLMRDRELHISVDREELRKLELTLDEVADVVSQYNRTVPSGTLPQGRGEYSVRAVGEAGTPSQLGEIAVRKHPSGSHVYLRDLGQAFETFERPRLFARLNGNPCKALAIAKTDEADSRTVAQSVEQAVGEFSASLPQAMADHVRVSTCLDSSDIIRSRIRILVNNLVSGIVLVFIALWWAIGWRNSILAIVGIPFSFLFALIFMQLLGVTINAVSLFALVLCSGMVVDDAIVVLENIYRHIEMARARPGAKGDKELRKAIVDGANEVLWPVVMSSLTTIVAFLPMFLMGGVTGKFFAIIPKTVTIVLLASLVECLLMIPVHYHFFGPRPWGRASKNESIEATTGLREGRGLLAQVIHYYGRVLEAVLRHRWIATLPLLAIGFLTYSLAPLLDVNPFPSDYQLVEIDVKTWDDASLEQTGSVLEPLEQIITSFGPQYVESVLTAVGLVATEDHEALWRNNLGQMHVKLADTDVVNVDPDAVSNRIREEIDRYVAEHPDCGVRSFRVWAPQDGPPMGKPVAVRIESTDLGAAQRLAERYKQRLAQIDGVSGIADNLDFGPTRIDLRLSEERASAHGLTQADLAGALRTANDGRIVTTFKDTRTGEDLDVRLLFDESYRQDLDDLLDIRVRTAAGYTLRLREICDVEMSQGYAGIPHYNSKRAVTVTAQIDTSVTTAHAVNTQLDREFRSTLAALPTVRVQYGGEFEETKRSFDGLLKAYLMAMVVVYMLLAAQFNNYWQPFVVIFTVPFACVGVVAGLLISSYPFTVMSFIALVGLTGVIVNDSIVLLDFINKQCQAGLAMRDAIVLACKVRLRPVFLTTVTTVLGLLPLALGLGGISKIWSPFASSFAWGLTFSTFVTLLIEPALYLIAHDVILFLRRRREPFSAGSEPALATPHAT